MKNLLKSLILFSISIYLFSTLVGTLQFLATMISTFALMYLGIFVYELSVKILK